jgi:hypothetical protein
MSGVASTVQIQAHPGVMTRVLWNLILMAGFPAHFALPCQWLSAFFSRACNQSNWLSIRGSPRPQEFWQISCCSRVGRLTQIATLASRICFYMYLRIASLNCWSTHEIIARHVDKIVRQCVPKSGNADG